MNVTYFIFILIAAIVMHYILVRNAHRFGLIDTPNERSMHKIKTPRGAGIAIFLSVILVQAVFNWEHLISYYLIYSAISVMFLVGLIDDFFNVSPRIKFIFLFFASLLVYFYGVQIDNLGCYFGYSLTLPWIFIFPFTFFAIAGLTNAYNLIDGLDGLAGSIGLIILTTFFCIGIANNDTLIITLSASFIAALISFLLFNWNPAQIFMGDSGSLTIGFVIAILCIQSLQYTNPTSVLFIVAVPLLDTFIVMTRRIQRGQSPFKADKNHLHHFLFSVKGDVRFVTFLLASLQAAFSIIGFQLITKSDDLSLILFGVLFFIFLNLFDQRIKRRKKTKKRRHQDHKQEIHNKSDKSTPSPVSAQLELP